MTLLLDPPFHISQTTTGDGAVATRPIRPGQLLFVENDPLVIQPEDASEQSILAALCHLPPARSQAFFTLSTSLDRKTPIRDIFQTNALPLGPCVPVSSSEPDIAYGVFTTLSRLNNSCTPNAAATWNDVTQRMSLHALRPIATNEEITITYGQPLFATRAERRSYLKRTRGFDCICGACRSTDPSSDARREELKRLFTSIPFVPDPATGVKMVRIPLHTNPHRHSPRLLRVTRADAKPYCTGTSSAPDTTNRSYRPVCRRLGIRCSPVLLCCLGREARP